MKRIFILILLFAFGLSSYSQTTIKCEIKTTLGNIFIELYPDQAPITVANFMRYVDDDLYQNSRFFRTCTKENEADREIKIEVIQGGDLPEDIIFDPIALETTEQTKLSHKDGTISMARAEPNTATSHFFICINDQPELDYGGKRNPDGQGFAAFGKVIKGMDIVRKIQMLENKNQQLLHPVTIITIQRIDI